MSRMELNKGKMIPVDQTVSQLAEENVRDTDDWQKYCKTKEEAFLWDISDYGYCSINGKIYKPDFTIEAGDFEDGFAEVNVNQDGSIDFHTFHYNGGGSLEEVIEMQLKLENN